MLLHFARDCQGGWRLVQFHGLFLKEEIEFSNILIKNLLENARTREPLARHFAILFDIVKKVLEEPYASPLILCNQGKYF